MVTSGAGAAVYLDTNVLIYLTEGKEALKQQVRGVLEAALAARARLVTSELAITEVMVRPLRERDQVLQDAYDELFSSFIEAIPIEREVLLRAAKLRAQTVRLRTPDAIHLATAQQLGAGVFVTGDAWISVASPMVRELISS